MKAPGFPDTDGAQAGGRSDGDAGNRRHASASLFFFCVFFVLLSWPLLAAADRPGLGLLAFLFFIWTAMIAACRLLAAKGEP